MPRAVPAEALRLVAGAAHGACRFLPVPTALASAAVSSAWCDGVQEALASAEVLDLHRCSRLADEDAIRLLRRCKSTRRLNVCGNRRLTDAAAIALAHSCPRLEELNLTGNPNVTVKGLDEVVKRCSRLESLQLSGCERVPENVVTGRYAKYCDIFDEEEEGPWAA